MGVWKVITLAVFLVILSGCVNPPFLTFSQIELQKKGFDPIYSTACGPTAISQCFGRFDIKLNTEQVGREIQQNDLWSDLSRNLLGTINWQGAGITWPDEIDKELQRHGLFVIHFTGDKKYLLDVMDGAAKHHEQGIALCKDGDKKLYYHYKEFPPTCDVMDSFTHTELIEVYLVLPR